MKMKRKGIRNLAFALLFLTASCAVSQVRLHDSYQHAWSTRLQEYHSTYSYKKKYVFEQDAVRFTPAAYPKTLSPAELWNAVLLNIKEVNELIVDASTFEGREMALREFLSHMNENPTSALTSSWFDRKNAELLEAAKAAEIESTAVIAALDEEMRKGIDWVTILRAISEVHGLLAGKAGEYALLRKEAGNYYTESAEDAARNRQIEAAFKNAADSLERSSYRQRLFNVLDRPRTCSFNGNMMTCY